MNEEMSYRIKTYLLYASFFLGVLLVFLVFLLIGFSFYLYISGTTTEIRYNHLMTGLAWLRKLISKYGPSYMFGSAMTVLWWHRHD